MRSDTPRGFSAMQLAAVVKRFALSKPPKKKGPAGLAGAVYFEGRCLQPAHEEVDKTKLLFFSDRERVTHLVRAARRAHRQFLRPAILDDRADRVHTGRQAVEHIVT